MRSAVSATSVPSVPSPLTALSAQSATVKNLGNGWSKSIVLENKVFLNFDFRHGAKKSGFLNHPLQSYGQIYFNIFR